MQVFARKESEQKISSTRFDCSFFDKIAEVAMTWIVTVDISDIVKIINSGTYRM